MSNEARRAVARHGNLSGEKILSLAVASGDDALQLRIRLREPGERGKPSSRRLVPLESSNQPHPVRFRRPARRDAGAP